MLATVKVASGLAIVRQGENTAEAARQAAVALAHADDAGAAAAVALAAAASADYRAARARELVAKVRAAAGTSSAVKLLVTADGTKTYRSGSVTDIATLTPLIGPAGVTLSAGTAFDGSGPTPTPALMPAEDTFGVAMHHQTGFTIADAVISNTGNFSIDMVIQWPAVAATFADVTAMNAALSAWPVGTLVYVQNPSMVVGGWPTQTDNLGGIQITSANVTGGYYVRGNGTWDKLNNPLIAGTNASSHRCEVGVDNIGRLSGFVYNGTTFAAPIQFYQDVIAYQPGKPQSLRLECDGSAVTLYWNGYEVGTFYAAPSFVPTTWYLNGNARTGSATIPVNGASWTLGALCVTQGLDYTQRRLVSNALAEAYGAPRVFWSDVVDLVINLDQSRTSGAELSTSGDPNRPDSISNWNGMLTRRRTNDPLGPNPSQEFLPGVYSVGNTTLDARNEQFGPLCCYLDGYAQASNAASFTQSGSGSETIEWGFAKQWRLAEGGRQNHLYFIGLTIGGQTLAYLKGKSGTYLHSLMGKTVTELGTYAPRDWQNRSIIALVKRAHARGQKVRVVVIANLQAEADATTVGIAAQRETDMRDWWDNDISKIVDITSPPPLMLFKTPSYSGDGTGNGCNTAASNYVDDAQRRLSGNRDTGHRLRTLTSTAEHCGRFIHWCALRIRLLGEVIGDLARRALHEGNDIEPLQVVSAVRSGTNIVLTTNRAVTIVSQALPTVLGTLTTGGYNTYGIVYEPAAGGAARAIGGNVTLDGTGKVITVPISGGGALAGDRINVKGTGARWTNFREATTRTGQYRDQNWGSSIPFSAAAPTIDLTGGYNDLTEWLAPSSHVLS